FRRGSVRDQARGDRGPDGLIVVVAVAFAVVFPIPPGVAARHMLALAVPLTPLTLRLPPHGMSLPHAHGLAALLLLLFVAVLAPRIQGATRRHDRGVTPPSMSGSACPRPGCDRGRGNGGITAPDAPGPDNVGNGADEHTD